MLINVGPEEGVDVIGAETEIIDKAKSDGQLARAVWGRRLRGLVSVFEAFQSCVGQVMTVFEAFQKGMKQGRAEVRGRRGRERNEERWKMNRWEEQKSKRPPSSFIETRLSVEWNDPNNYEY